MDFVTIQSASNNLVKRIRSLHTRLGRKKAHQFLAEGESVAIEAVLKGAKISELILSTSYMESAFKVEKFPGISEAIVLDDKLFQTCSTTDSPKGILCVIEKEEHSLDSALKSEIPLISVACEVTDPGNLGTMMRSCLAFGSNALILTKGTVDPYNPKVVRSAAGSVFSLPVIIDVSIDELLDWASNNNIQTVSLVGMAKTSLSDLNLKKPSLLILGNEARGLPQSLIEKSDLSANIPIAPNCESLNVSIAHAISIWEANKQRL